MDTLGMLEAHGAGPYRIAVRDFGLSVDYMRADPYTTQTGSSALVSTW